jgi:hypothetical protein
MNKGCGIDAEAACFGTATVANVRGVRLDDPYPARPADVLPYPLVVPVWGVVTKSEANQREHWAARHRRFKRQRAQLAEALRPFRDALAAFGSEVLHGGGRLAVQFTRIGPRKLDDDNLTGAFKALRDELAKWLVLDDGDERVDWRRPHQRRGEDGVIVSVAYADAGQ